ncbi:MAG: hypothetical protein J1F42_06140 [Lachnospiraceae bacterium]|nr:hypothetical protein [Lachnospiraceae bacterium]
MDYNQMPLDLGIAITSNRAAMDRFVDMTDDEKSEFIERSRGVMSKSEIDRLVDSLVPEEEQPDVHLEDVKDIFKGPSIG